MTEHEAESPPSVSHQPFARKVQLKVSKTPEDRPTYPTRQKTCLLTYSKLGGVEGLTLWDAGSTTTAASPAFSQVAGLKVFPLKNPVALQLGTVGSRSNINFGSNAKLTIPGFDNQHYFDIVNLDRYDIVISTPFMHQNNVKLDFESNAVWVNGTHIPAIDGSEGMVARELANCQCLNRK
ncbi:hypothetical protein DL96DRAFT_1476311 [Flagelloscypha sp. PMI_526]|nr:hypothetical protein DL96DRAFT_1476311 [Flagelloscypha sp. PMI_526]